MYSTTMFVFQKQDWFWLCLTGHACSVLRTENMHTIMLVNGQTDDRHKVITIAHLVRLRLSGELKIILHTVHLNKINTKKCLSTHARSSREQLRWQEVAVMASSGVLLTAHSLFNNVEILVLFFYL